MNPQNRVNKVIPSNVKMSKVWLSAVINTFLSPGEHVIDVDQREHGKGANKGAGLDRDAAPQQGFVAGLVKHSADDHLQIGEEAGENNPGDDL